MQKNLSKRAFVPVLLLGFLLFAGCSPGLHRNLNHPSPTPGDTPQSAISTIRGEVVSVHDGDTVTVLAGTTQVKVRLAGIDAPELGQAFGQKSKQNLSQLIFRRAVDVYSNKIDHYGRTVGKIICDGLDVNLEQIRNGFAWHYKQYEKEQSPEDRTSYASAEIYAREHRLGLWADADPTPPWDRRHDPGNANRRSPLSLNFPSKQ